MANGPSPTGPTGLQYERGGIGPQGPSAAPLPTFAANAKSQALGPGLAAGSEKVCAAAIAQRAGLGSAPVLSGTGTDAGRPVVVAVFSRARTFVVYVLAASDCKVVSRQTLP